MKTKETILKITREGTLMSSYVKSDEDDNAKIIMNILQGFVQECLMLGLKKEEIGNILVGFGKYIGSKDYNSKSIMKEFSDGEEPTLTEEEKETLTHNNTKSVA